MAGPCKSLEATPIDSKAYGADYCRDLKTFRLETRQGSTLAPANDYSGIKATTVDPKEGWRAVVGGDKRISFTPDEIKKLTGPEIMGEEAPVSLQLGTSTPGSLCVMYYEDDSRKREFLIDVVKGNCKDQGIPSEKCDAVVRALGGKTSGDRAKEYAWKVPAVVVAIEMFWASVRQTGRHFAGGGHDLAQNKNSTIELLREQKEALLAGLAWLSTRGKGGGGQSDGVKEGEGKSEKDKKDSSVTILREAAVSSTIKVSSTIFMMGAGSAAMARLESLRKLLDKVADHPVQATATAAALLGAALMASLSQSAGAFANRVPLFFIAPQGMGSAPKGQLQ